MPFLKQLAKQALSNTIDVCGTGGDGQATFNISTAAAFVVASCGIQVAKHGNRAISSRCGSSDLMEALGVPLELAPEKMYKVFKKTGLAYLHAPLYHPSLKAVQILRQKIKQRTIFNLLGPLVNPYRVSAQLIGVYPQDIVSTYVSVIRALGSQNTVLVHSQEGWDEIHPFTSNSVTEIRPKAIKKWTYDGVEKKTQINSPGGKNAKENTALLKQVLKNDSDLSDIKKAVAINAAFGIYALKPKKKITDLYQVALTAIESGKAYQVMENFIQLAQS
jgi:anthranilate phosphoribosyltransferase